MVGNIGSVLQALTALNTERRDSWLMAVRPEDNVNCWVEAVVGLSRYFHCNVASLTLDLAWL